ncbi:MAG: ABC transporter substrate-binding protein [Acetobacteraceae bacterium]|nr:ABC transporter substrate-binding protein [Acetobacteraceae bacterium]
MSVARARWAVALWAWLLLAGPVMAAEDGLKLGVLNDLTGSFADLGGRGSILATQMAVEDFGGKVLGKPISIISADSQNKPDIASGIARRWFDAEGVDAIIDPVPSSVALAVEDLARERNRMVIVTSSGLAEVTGKRCAPTTFQWAYDTAILARGTAAAIADQQPGAKWFFVTADVAFGHSLAEESKAVVRAHGGSVLGEADHPYINADFSAFLIEARASGADIVALANSGADATNSIKQAAEFGIGRPEPRLVALLAFVTDIYSLGLEATQGLYLTESFYWDLDDATRAWSRRFASRFGGKMPSMAQAAAYSGVTHYLKAIAAAGTTDAGIVADKMREMPIDDFMMHGGRARIDGRVVHDFYLFQVKTPAESTGPWDLYKLVRRIPADEITPAPKSTGCPR